MLQTKHTLYGNGAPQLLHLPSLKTKSPSLFTQNQGFPNPNDIKNPQHAPEQTESWEVIALQDQKGPFFNHQVASQDTPRGPMTIPEGDKPAEMNLYSSRQNTMASKLKSKTNIYFNVVTDRYIHVSNLISIYSYFNQLYLHLCHHMLYRFGKYANI